MKIIDLLNKIANGEEVPKKIIYNTFTYWYDEVEKDYYHYVAKDLDDEDIEYLLDSCFASDILNEEIQIIEDTPKEKKIPEKLSTWFSVENVQNNGVDKTEFIIKYANHNFETYFNKTNEIIDYLDYLKSKGE